MLAQENGRTYIGVPQALRLVGVIAGVWALLVVLAATLAYLPGHPGFSPFTTFLSDIGDTPGWPQILFNSGTLIAAPLRYLVLVLVVLRLSQIGAGRTFATAVLIIGFASTAGTVMMTATPFSVSPVVHKTGIGLYFLGVVILQSLVFAREWSLKAVPRLLPALSATVVVVFLAFVTLLILHERDVVARTAPVTLEWLAFFSSVVWVFAQSILLSGAGVDRWSSAPRGSEAD